VATAAKHENAPVGEIVLDRANPRIRKFLEMYGETITPDQIYQALGAAGDDESESSTSFEKLTNSVLTNGGIIQPVILNRRSDGTLVCIEGNTRVALYQSFIAESVKGDWTSIPAIVYCDMTEAQIDAIRLQVHLVGTRAWDPYSKAKYLHQLRTQELMPFERIVEFSGGRKKEIVESINAFSDMEQHYRPILPDDSAFDTRRFSGFVELQKPGIKDAVLVSGFTLNDFALWIHEDKLSPLNTIRSLPRILRNQKAREAFLKYGAKEAMKLLVAQRSWPKTYSCANSLSSFKNAKSGRETPPRRRGCLCSPWRGSSNGVRHLSSDGIGLRSARFGGECLL
jgi:hypothetical protein